MGCGLIWEKTCFYIWSYIGELNDALVRGDSCTEVEINWAAPPPPAYIGGGLVDDFELD